MNVNFKDMMKVINLHITWLLSIEEKKKENLDHELRMIAC